MRMRESYIEQEFIRQAVNLNTEILGTQIELPVGRLDVLGRWHHFLAVFEIKSSTAGGDAIAQAMSYAIQVSQLVGMEDAGGVRTVIVAPALRGEAIRAWRASLCEFIMARSIEGEVRFSEQKRTYDDDMACLDESVWIPGKELRSLFQEHLRNEAEEIALLLGIRAQARSPEDGGARAEDMTAEGSVVSWSSI